MKKNLSIIMTTDKNYILQTRVAIWSMLNSAKKNIFFNIYILCNSQLEKADRESVFSLREKWNNMIVSFIEIDEQIFQNAKSVAYIPVASFYRLIISSVLKESRCLFLDGDIIVNSDLSNIYNIDLSAKYLAGVKDCRIHANINKEMQYCSKLNIPTIEGYVNAGVLVLNLDLIRKDGIDSKFLREMHNYYQYMDQDIINKCCFGKINYLDLKYNLFNDYYKKIDLLRTDCFSEIEKKEADEKFAIMHFAGRYKPWNSRRIRGSELWWNYAKKALDTEDYNEIYNKVVETDKKSDWIYILEKCKDAEDIIVIGFSQIGKNVVESLRRCGVIQIRCFCDNSKEKQLYGYDNLKVYSFERALKRYPKALWINTSQKYRDEINTQLYKMGVLQNKIVVYFNKADSYYDLLDEQYKEYEEEQLILMKCGKKK